MKHYEMAEYFGIPKCYVSRAIRAFMVTDPPPLYGKVNTEFTVDQIGRALLDYFAERKAYLNAKYTKPDLPDKLKNWDRKTETVQSKLNTI